MVKDAGLAVGEALGQQNIAPGQQSLGPLGRAGIDFAVADAPRHANRYPECDGSTGKRLLLQLAGPRLGNGQDKMAQTFKQIRFHLLNATGHETR